MKSKIFISFLSSDQNKAKSLGKEIERQPSLDPIIVINRRELRKLFSQQVKNAIDEAEYVIPIITKDSLGSQWVNQEIGYAEAKGKMVFPLIESQVLNKLKGFIHKEEEHFLFKADKNKVSESRQFRKAYMGLIEHILGLNALSASKNYQTTFTTGNNRITLDYQYQLTRRSKLILNINQTLPEQSFVVYLKIVTDKNENFWIGFSNLGHIRNSIDLQHIFKIAKSNKIKYSIDENIFDKIDESGLKITGKPISIEAIRFRGAEGLNEQIHYYYTIMEK